jgi:hypothetical protein
MQSGEVYYRQLANTNKSLNKIPNLQNTQTNKNKATLFGKTVWVALFFEAKSAPFCD